MLIYNLCLKVIFKKIKNWVQTVGDNSWTSPMFRKYLKFYAFFKPFPKGRVKKPKTSDFV